MRPARIVPLVPFLGLVVLLGPAQARSSFSGAVSLTGLYYGEQQLPGPSLGGPLAATPLLMFADLRLLLVAQHLGDRVDLRLDARVRATGSLDFEGKFTDPGPRTQDPFTGQFTAQGYLRGREYDLREAFMRVRLGDRTALQLGRMFVPEADQIKVDGLRLLLHLGRSWEGSLFAGGYPDPYSRSLFTDYTPACGDGVAGDSGDIPCQSPGPQVAVAGGLTVRYQYDTNSGAASVAGSFFGGAGDGGPLRVNPDAGGALGNLLPASAGRDPPRVYVSWTHSYRPLARLDLLSDVVVDLFGSAGPQPTRVLLLANFRPLRRDRLTLRLSYSHMSSLAINMYLSRLLYNRAPNGSAITPDGLGVVENNLTVLRTGRDEGRAGADLRLTERLLLSLDGRIRERSLLGGDHADLAGDVTLALRDRGSLLGLRLSAGYTFLVDFRSRSHVARAALGRDFLRQRLGFELGYVLDAVRDAGVDQPDAGCARPNTAGGLAAPIDPLSPGCFGRRNGTTHESGLTVTTGPWSGLFLLVDYRFVALLSAPEDGQQVPTVFSHSVLLRSEVRF